MPVNLLLAGRPCLVVGAGKVALRKTRNLLEAGARVTVVSPAHGPEFDGLMAAGRIDLRERHVEDGDVDGMAVVFACTNDRAANRRVLEACRARKVLCGCVDGNWATSDFTTPATTRHGELTVAVSTGGQSCRRAKLVRNSLARHIESIETADLVVVGTDHRHLPLEQREPFHLDLARMRRTGFMLMQIWGVHEFLLLNTCNRVEVVAVASREAGTNGILRHALGFDRLDASQYYLKRGAEAWEHVAMVCAGMLSQTPGEKHIAAQIKEALAMATDEGWANGMMQQWMAAALHASKHIKNEVVPNIAVCEIEALALRCLQARQPDLKQKTLMVLGSGSIGCEVVRGARSKVARILWCYHSRRPGIPAGSPATIELCPLSTMQDRLPEADVIVSALDAPGQVLTTACEPHFKQDGAVLLIDLGVPRNTDPAIRTLPNVAALIDMDGLKHWFHSEQADLDGHFEDCRQIIQEHRESYQRLIDSFQGSNASAGSPQGRSSASPDEGRHAL